MLSYNASIVDENSNIACVVECLVVSLLISIVHSYRVIGHDYVIGEFA